MQMRATPRLFYSKAARRNGWLAVTLALWIGFVLAGCSPPGQAPQSLIRIRDRDITVDEFKQAVAAAAEETISGEAGLDPEALNQLRVQVLKQLTEEIIIMERGKDLGLILSEEELEAAVTRIKADYPDNTFDDILLEHAVSYEIWEKKLAVRLLVEKVVASELIDQVRLSPEDIADYYQSLPPSSLPAEGGNDEQNEKIVLQLRRLKAEEAYEQWIDRLREQYPVEINRKQWENLVRVENS